MIPEAIKYLRTFLGSSSRLSVQEFSCTKEAATPQALIRADRPYFIKISLVVLDFTVTTISLLTTLSQRTSCKYTYLLKLNRTNYVF